MHVFLKGKSSSIYIGNCEKNGSEHMLLRLTKKFKKQILENHENLWIFKKFGSLNCIFFVFEVRTIGSGDTITSRQCERATTTAARARARGDDIKDSQIPRGRVALIGSHRRRIVSEQFRAPHNIWHRASIHVARWTINLDDELVVEDFQAIVKDDMNIMVET